MRYCVILCICGMTHYLTWYWPGCLHSQHRASSCHGSENKNWHIDTWTKWPTSLQTTFWCAWWRHQMEPFSALLAICAGNSPVSGEFPAKMPVTRSFDIFFDLRMNERLSKHSWGSWLETTLRPLWCQSNGYLECNWLCLITPHTKTKKQECDYPIQSLPWLLMT